MKNILVISGSPRKNGNTEMLAKAFVDGAILAGNHVKILSVIGKHIGGCLGCNACRRNSDNKCVLNDDMIECYNIMAKADVIVFATPIYFYGASSQLKAMIDRLHNPIRNTFKVKKLGLLAVCADNEMAVFNSVKEMYNSCLRYFSLENGGIVTVCGVEEKGDISGNTALSEAEEMGRNI